MDACGSMYTEKQTHGSMSKDACGSVYMDVSTASKGMTGRTCLYIYTKGTCVHIVMSMVNSTVKIIVRGRTNAYGKCWRYKYKQDIGTDLIGKVWKGIIYTDALHQGS